MSVNNPYPALTRYRDMLKTGEATLKIGETMIRMYVAKSRTTGEILDGLPTPRLIQAGYGEAYVKDGIVYLREPGYDSPDGTYHRVNVILNPEWEEQERRLYGHLGDR